MKLFTTRQIPEIDRYTIENEPISDSDLMERAAGEMFRHLVNNLPQKQPVLFYAGPGNNGGDAMAIARMFANHGYPCSLYLLDAGRALTGAAALNRQRLDGQGKVKVRTIASEADFPVTIPGATIIDGLFGSGLTRPLEGLTAALVRHINRSGARICAIDVPSGLMGEDNSGNDPGNIVQATETMTLQFPKLSLLFPENEKFAGKVVVLDIGLHPDAMEQKETPYRITEKAEVREMIPVRSRFSHKGMAGHALLIAGSYGKMGAALLASRACMRSGAGLLTAHGPRAGYTVMQAGSPEAICSTDEDFNYVTRLPVLEKYNAIGAGPGLGTEPETQKALLELLETAEVPLLLDADALNILSENRQWLEKLPANSILTPHPGEFRRLFGEMPGTWQKIEAQRKWSRENQIIIVLKGANTSISLPNGALFFNPTGNPGMATGGSGDVLTGIILGLMSVGMAPENSAIAGVYIHGLAGDLGAAELSGQALTASDIVGFLGKAFLSINHPGQP